MTGMERAVQESSNDGSAKRKMDDPVEIAKQKAQEIAGRLINSAESKRPRLDSFTAVTAPASVSDLSSSIPSTQSSYPVSYSLPTGHQYNGSQGSSKKILIPNAKVGVIIGRGGDMIKNLQLRSGARIQITRDADADPSSLTRDVEIMGTTEQIVRAEQLINEVIEETDAATGSALSGNRGISPLQPGAEQKVLRVPNDKVALIIGKGGETIKNMQSKSGARIQVVPLHLPPGDMSTERSVYINGTREQIESAKDLINEVMSGNRLTVMSGSTGYIQAAYPTACAWSSQGQLIPQQPAYGYSQQGSYPVAPQYYGSYPTQPASWDQTNPSPTSTIYNPYGQRCQQAAAAPNVSYNYGQAPSAASYGYAQGYSQQPPTYGQDVNSQACGSSAPSSEPDGAGTALTSQPAYSAPAVSSQPEETNQSHPSPAYQTGYCQPNSTPTNGYGAYPVYGAPPSQPAYDQVTYSQTNYGQQGAQLPATATYPYYGQGGYPPAPQAPSQAGYYQGTYPPTSGQPVVQSQVQQQSTNGVPQEPVYGAEKAHDGTSANPSDGSAQETDNQQS